MNESQTYILRTLGCKANLYDSQLIEAELQKRGWKPGGETSRLCIVNSCTVTDEADRQSRKMASRLARENPSARVVMTGCAAEVDPERMAAAKGVHYVIGNRDKPHLVDLILQTLEQTLERDPSAPKNDTPGLVLGTAIGYSEMLSRHPIDREWYLDEGFRTPPARLTKTRAFLKIQEGCNAFCTYCIIPYGRGPSRSLKPGEVVRQIRELVSEGVQEVVITGTNIGDYGTDWADGAALVELFRSIFAETDLRRLRVSSLDPAEITSELLQLMKTEKRFCPHFHVSLQSPHARILRLMKRKYSTARVQACLEEIAQISAARGGVFVGMDVITGFPGETDEEFEESAAILERLPWTRLHVFPYSERGGTPATRLPDPVPHEIRAERARRLNAMSLQRMKGHYERLLAQGKPIRSVLLERARDGVTAGYSPEYVKVLIPANPALRNAIVDVQPTGIEVDAAAGEVALTAALLDSEAN